MKAKASYTKLIANNVVVYLWYFIVMRRENFFKRIVKWFDLLYIEFYLFVLLFHVKQYGTN